MKESKFVSVLTSILTALFLLTGAVAVPLLWRGFYYRQIDALHLSYRSGFSPEVIREAFDQVMDYLVGTAQFGTGQLKWSQMGHAHFADCRNLFLLDFFVLAVSALLLLLILTLCCRGKLRLYRFGNRGPCFWALVGLSLALGVLLVWALLDFEGLFTAFHAVCFPGKDNWVFDWRTDQIILILPEAFWARAAALVGAVAFGGGAVLAGIESAVYRFGRPRTVYDELRQMRR